MHISKYQTVAYVQERGTDAQSTAAKYFDVNDNGMYDAQEADTFNNSKIVKTEKDLTITSPTGFVDKFESMSEAKDEKYYKSGSKPVAVVDCFSGEGMGGKVHGTTVSNIIKSINPDIAVSNFDVSPINVWNKAQKFVDKIYNKMPRFEEFMYTNKVAQKFAYRIFGGNTTAKAMLNSIEQIQTNISNGTNYTAVNMSQGFDCSYDDINKICSNKLNVKITPENIAEYKSQIKDILKANPDKKISYQYNYTLKCGKITEMIESIEKLNTPVYIAGSYKGINGEPTFNLLALADNTLSVEAGISNGDKVIISSAVSSNSLSTDKASGKKRVQDSMVYTNGDLTRGSTSFATPMQLAKDLKNTNK